MKIELPPENVKPPDGHPPSQSTGYFAEMLLFLKTHKIWWLTPIAVILLVFVVLVLLSATGVAPFMYPNH